MSQFGTRTVVLHSSPGQHVHNTNTETTETRSFRMDTTPLQTVDPDTNYPMSKIAFRVSSNDLTDDSEECTAKTSTQVIWTCRTTTGGAPTEVKVQTHTGVTTTTVSDEKTNRRDSKNIHGGEGKSEEDKRGSQVYHSKSFSQPPTFSEMKTRKYSPIEFGSQHSLTNIRQDRGDTFYSTQVSKTSTKSGSTTSYTYKVQDSIAILENVTKRATKIDIKTVSQTHQNGEKSETQTAIENEQHLLTNGKQAHTTGIKIAIRDQTERQGQGTIHFNKQTTSINKGDHVENTKRHSSPTSDTQSKKQLSAKNLPSQPEKAFAMMSEDPQAKGHSTQQSVIIQASAPPKMKKRNSDDWITHTKEKKELSVERPALANKLSTEKIQLHQHLDTPPNITLRLTTPEKLQTTDFTQYHNSMKDRQISSQSNMEKRNTVKSTTYTTTSEHTIEETLLKTNQMTGDQVKAFNKQETNRVPEMDISSQKQPEIRNSNSEITNSPGQTLCTDQKIENRNIKGWIPHTITKEEFRSVMHPPTNKLSSEKVQFLRNQGAEKIEKQHPSSPGRLVIQDFHNDASSVEVHQLPSPPKVIKINAEQWIMQSINQKKIGTELSPPTEKLSGEEMQFLHNQDTQPTEKLHVSLPGKLVIPNFHQESSSVEVQKVSKPPEVEKRNVEEWITQTVKQEEVRSELPLSPPSKLSSEKMQFLHNHETEQVQKVHFSSPGRLVVPDFNKDTSSVEEDGMPSPPRVDKINAEQWITQTNKQDELRSELPPPTKKLSADKMHFVHYQETQRAEKLHVSLPGKLVIPNFNQESSSVEEQKVSKPAEVEKRNVQEWITQTVKQEEVRSELPLSPPSKLSSQKMQFLHNQETQKVEKVHVTSPGRLVIPDFNKDSPSVEEDGLPSPPKVDKINAEQWIMQTNKQDELRSELPPPTKKLSADKMQFLHNQDTQPTEKLHVSSPGKLVIPNFHQESSSVEVQKVSKPPEVEKRNVEEWITQTVKQEEVRSELPLSPPSKLSSEKMQFLHNQETEQVEKVHFSSPGRLVIPDFNKDTSSVEEDGMPSPPRVDKINAEQWITQTNKQDELRSELPPPTKKLSADKMHFVHYQETQRAEKLHVSLPGKLVIPNFNQESSSVEEQKVSKPAEVEKRNVQEWITQTVKQEEVRSELPLSPPSKLSSEKMQFLHNQETQKVEKAHVTSPGRLVIPDFNKDSPSVEEDGLPSPPKVDKINAEQWIMQTNKQDELRSELPPPTKKLSPDKMQFLHNQDTQPSEKLHVSSPGKLVIPNFHQESSSVEVQKVSKPPEVEKRNVEEWITQTVKQEEVRSELPLSPPSKLSSEKMQFLHNQETEQVEKVHFSSPGRLVIPDFNKDTSSVEEDGMPSPPRVDKINAEQWITQTNKQDELRSELPPPTKKLSADKMHFVHYQETQRAEKLHVSLPGKLVIPNFNQESSSVEEQKVSKPAQVEKRNVQEWITQTVKQEEVRSELPLSPPSKLSSEKMQFLHNQETQKVEKVHVTSPGRLVIPDFNKDSPSVEEDGLPSPPKVDKINAEQWIMQTNKQDELRSELPPPTKKLSADKMQFLHNHDTQPSEKLHVSSPGKLVIPNFHQESSSVEVQKVSKPPEVEKRNVEEWITQTVKQEEVRSELPLSPPSKLSSEKMQFLHNQETEQVEKVHFSSPGRLVIPDFNKDTSSVEEDGMPSPPRVDKINAEQWITQTNKQDELRSELPPPTKKLSADKMHFVHYQETQRAEKLHVSLPGKLVIPNFNQESSSVEEQKVSKPAEVEKRNVQEWITQTVKQEEVRSELPLSPPSKLSSEKMQFLHNQETQKVEKAHVTSPGRLVIPDFNKDSPSVEEDGLPSPPKVDKINAEQWIMQTNKQDELRSELPPPTKKLSADKMQFLHNQDTQPSEKLHVSSPGKLVIPNFHQESSSVEVQKVSKPPEVEKRNVEEWITQTVKQEEVRSELPLSPPSKLSSEKMQFLHNQETEQVEKVHFSSPGRLVIPDFNKDTSSVEEDGMPSPPRVDKINAEQWITQTNKQDELRSELPPPTKKLSADKMHFVHYQETQRAEKLHVSLPGKLVIPNFNQESSSVEEQKVSKPAQVEKRNVQEWITQTVKQEEVRSELPLSPPSKLSSEKMQFLHNQETQKVEKVHVTSPGRLVIPDFNKDSPSVEEDGLPSPPKVDKINAEQWIMQTNKQDELRSELPPPTKKLSADKMQFLHNHDTQPSEKLHVSSPGKLVIPNFHQESSSVEVQKVSKPPEVEKRNVEEWITQTVKQEEVRSELPLSPPSKLSSEKMQFLHNQETEQVEKVHFSSPGRLVIPDFNKDTSSVEEDGMPSPPRVDKINAEQWITQTNKQDELRSELPPPTKKLSADKMHFVHYQETQRAEKLHVSLPGKLVIPNFNQESSSVEEQKVSKPAQVEKRNVQEWITQTVKQEEVRSELPLSPPSKLSSEKMQFLHNQETQKVEKVHVTSPGRLVIPDFNKDSPSVEEDGLPSPPKVDKINAEQWIMQTNKQDELRSELPPPTKKLSADKMQFLHNQDTQPSEKLHVSSPGKLVIPNFHQESSSVEVQKVSKPPEVEKRNVEEWITQTVKQEEVRSELPLSPPSKLSSEKMQFLHNQETEQVEKVHFSSPGRLVIPDFNKDTSSVEEDGMPSPPRVDKINAEQWITQTNKQDELRSELPPPTKKLSADKMHFVHYQETQRAEKLHVSLPGKLVIPNFNQESSSVEEQKVSKPAEVEKRNVQEWITQTVKQEEVRSELPLSPPSKLSSEKMQFLHNQETQKVEKVHVTSPGRLVIPDFNKDSPSVEEDGLPSPPKVDKINAEQWIMQTNKQDELRSELPPPTKKLSADKMQFLHNQDTQPTEKLHVSSPGKLVIPNFHQESSSVEVQKVSKPPEVEKRNVEEWITQTVKQEEVRSELPLSPPSKLSSEKMQFLHNQETEQVEKVHFSSPGRLVIPDFNKDTSSVEEDGMPSPPRVDKINAEQWITQTNKQDELRSELQPPTKKLSADKMHFVHYQETQRAEKLHVSLPGKLVIPNFNQESSSVEEQKVSKPAEVEKRNVQEWITQTVKQEEVRSELPLSPPSKLSSQKMQFLHNQETQKVEKVHVTSPGRLVIPDFNKDSPSVEEDGLPSPPKVDKINAEQWIMQTNKQDELRSELPPPTKKLSADKMQFLHNQDTQPTEELHVSSPGKLVIPNFHQESSSLEVQKVSKPPEVEKRNVEEWITQTVKQEEVRSEFPLSPPSKLSSEKMQFLHNQETEQVEKVHFSSPGRLVIPDFNKDTSSVEEDGMPSPPRVDKINAEQWITQTNKQDELRSELPPPTKKLSADKMHFVHYQETQRAEKLHVSLPGKLVIPNFNQESSSVEEQKVSKPAEVEKRNVQEWITQTVKQEEVRSELPLSPPSKLSSEKMQFLHNQKTQKVEKVHVTSPGRLVIPDFNKDSPSVEEDGLPSPPKVDKINAEQWIMQTNKQDELRSELPPPTKKLSADKMQFLHNQDTQPTEKLHVSSPGKLVIPNFHQESSSVEVQKVSKPPEMEKRNVEEWITQTVKQEEVRSELPLSPPSKLSSEKMQFLHNQETQKVEKVHVTSPGRLVIPDFNKDSPSVEEDGLPSPPKVDKINAEQWIMQTNKQDELRSELPPPTKKLSADKMQFLHNQDTQPTEKLHVSSPGKLVIPNFHQESSSVEVQKVSKPPEVEKRNVEEWITQTVKQEEVRSELPLSPPSKLSSEKMQFLHNQETEQVEKVHFSSPGRLVIPDFNKDTSSVEEDGMPSPPRVDKINAEQWITQTNKQDELRSELPPPTKKLSADKMHFVHYQETQRAEKLHVSLPGKLVIPNFNQESSSVEEQKVSKPAEVEKRNVQEWITQTVKQEEVRSELPLSPPSKLSSEKMQFLHNQETRKVEKVHVTSPGRLVIPDFNKDSPSVEEDRLPSPPKVDKINAEQWIMQTNKQDELRSELPPPTKKLSADKMQFLHNQDTQPTEKLHVSSPGKLVIPNFHQESSSVEVQKVSKPPEVEKRNVEEWITETVKQEDVRSELPLSPTSKLSSEKMQFLHNQETEQVEKVHFSSPGRLVIPDFNKDTSSVEEDGMPSPPRVDKINAEQWITQTNKQDELRSELPPPTKKLSADKMHFVHYQETQRAEKLHVSLPGKLVIPNFNQESSSVEEQKVSKPAEVEKRNVQEWITQTVKQEEVRSELPLSPPSKLSSEKMQFLHNQETQKVGKVLVTSPGRLVVPDFNKDSPSVEEDGLPSPPKVDKINAEQWIMQTNKQDELRSELPPPTKKLSADKMQFLHNQDTQPTEKLHVSSPGKLVIPNFHQESSSVEVQKVSKPPEVEKRNVQEWITQTVKQEEVRSELPLSPPSKLSSEKMQFLHNQETQKVEKVHVTSPGRLVIPDFNKDSPSVEEDRLPSPPKVDKINAEQWIMQTNKQDELRSELPPPTKKLSADKMQFLHNQDTQPTEKLHVSSPGKLVIPNFHQESSSVEVQKVSKPPEVEKRNVEEWITETVKQEEVRSELPLSPPSKLSSEKMQFLHNQETEQVEKVHFSSPGRLVIPDFNKDTSSVEEDGMPSPPRVDKINAEQWITQTNKQDELRSELPPPTKKLSADKMHFVHYQETQRAEKLHVSLPGKLVIPNFNQESSSVEEQKVSKPAEVEKRNVQEWITQTVKQEEVRSELPLSPPSKLSSEKMQFLHNQETQKVEKVHVTSPGRLVIPDFNKDSPSVEEDRLPSPPKVDKINAEQWIMQTNKQDELRSELPPPTKKLSADKMQFLHNQDTQPTEKHHVSSPGKLVIPNFHQESSSVEVQKVSKPPEVEKRNVEEWITETVKQEEVRSELPLSPPSKLSSEKMQFLHNQETEQVEKVHFSSPGRLVIPDFNKDTSSVEEDGMPSPPRVDKINAEQWITQTNKQDELRSELPPPTKKLSADKMHFVHYQETQRAEKLHVSLPGKLVIPNFNQESSSVEEQKVSKPAEVEKRNVQEWITQTVKQEEVRSELPLSPPSKLSSEKMQFLHNQETQKVGKVHVTSHGRLVVPDFNKDSPSVEEDGLPSPPKVDKINAEQWIMQTNKQDELRSELPPPTKKLSADKMQFLHNQDTQPTEKLHVSSPGKLVIPNFHQESSSVEVQKVSKPPEVEKRNVQEWITQTVKQEEVRSELPLSPPSKLSSEKMQFLHNQETEQVGKVHFSSPGRLVIPDFNKDTSSVEEDGMPSPPRVDKINAEQWITQTNKQDELRSELPPPTKKLSADKMHFVHYQETQRAEKLHVSLPGKLVIPNFNQESSSVEEQKVSKPAEVEKRNVQEWITQTVKQEEVRSELPLSPPSKLSSEKMQFLHNQETQKVGKVHVTSHGRLVVPDFNKDSPSVEEDGLPSPPKVDKINAEQWIMQTNKQDELRSELPPPTKKLSADKMQFLHNQDTQPTEKLHVSSPGKLVIPNFHQESSSVEVQKVSKPPEVEKRNVEEWITQTVKQEEVRSELPLSPPSKLSSEKMQFLTNQETEQVEKVHFSSPGRLVIPDFNKDSSAVEEDGMPSPPRVDKINAEQWITQTNKQDELRSELPPPTKKLSADKMHFVHYQETQRAEKLHVSLPGKLVIPNFNQESSSVEEQKVSKPAEVEKRNVQDWITQTVKEEEVRSELPLSPPSKLSSEKMQLLTNQETQKVKKVEVSLPRRLDIRDFHKDTSSGEQLPSRPKVDKINAEQWIMQSLKQEEVRSELLPTRKEFSAEKIQFLYNQETQRIEKRDVSSPGKLLIPSFLQEDCSIEVEEVLSPPEVEKINSEIWITQIIKGGEVRAYEQVSCPRNKLSSENMQFLENQRTQHVEKVVVSSPRKAVIPDFHNDRSFEEEVKPASPSIVEKIKAEQWITQSIKQDLRSELPSPTKKLSADRMQFLHNHETHRVEKLPVSSPGKLVIPEFHKDSSSKGVEGPKSSPNVDKINSEIWITQTIRQEELPSEISSTTNKLSIDKMEFLHDQETHTVENRHVSSPRRLVIPGLFQNSSSFEGGELPFAPNVENINGEEWTTVNIKEEAMKSPGEKKQFLQYQEGCEIVKLDVSSSDQPVTVDVNDGVCVIQVEEAPRLSKLQEGNSLEWIAERSSHEVPRSNVGHLVNKHSAEKMGLIHIREKKQPGKLVFPDFDAHSFSDDAKKVDLSLRVGGTQTTTHEERKSGKALQINRLSAEKIQFVQTQETQPGRTSSNYIPGKLAIPDFNQHSSFVEVHETSPTPKVDKLNAHQWITETTTHEELRTDVPPQTKNLSQLKFRFINTQDTPSVVMSQASKPGKVVIPGFNKERSSTEVHELSPPPKGQKRNAKEWITHSMTREELRTVPLPVRSKLSEDKVEFIRKQETRRVDTSDGFSPGRLVIPDFSHQNFSVEVEEVPRTPSKMEKSYLLKWEPERNTDEEVRTEVTRPRRELSANKFQFVQETQSARISHGSPPGRIAIPDYGVHTLSFDVQEGSVPQRTEHDTQSAGKSHCSPPGRIAIPDYGVHRLSFDVHEESVLQKTEHDTQSARISHCSPPGRITIPDYGVHTYSFDVQEGFEDQKTEQRHADQRLKQSVMSEKLIREESSATERLSTGKLQFVCTEDPESVEMSHRSKSGKLVILDFDQHGSSIHVHEESPPPTEENKWMTHSLTREEIRALPLPSRNQFSEDKLPFLQTQTTQRRGKPEDGSPPGKLVIPDYGSHSYSIEAQESKGDRRAWKAHTISSSGEHKSVLTSQTNTLPTAQVQFRQIQENQHEKKVPGKLVIPAGFH